MMSKKMQWFTLKLRPADLKLNYKCVLYDHGLKLAELLVWILNKEFTEKFVDCGIIRGVTVENGPTRGVAELMTVQ